MHLVRLFVLYPGIAISRQPSVISPIGRTCLTRPTDHCSLITDHRSLPHAHTPIRRGVYRGFAGLMLLILAMCVLCAPAFSATSTSGDPEKTATDPSAARQAKLQAAADSLTNLHFRQAISEGREVLSTAKEAGEILRAEEIVVQGTRSQSGCKAALDQANLFLAQAEQFRPKSAQEMDRLKARIAELKSEAETCEKALAGQRAVLEKRPGTAQAAEAVYRIARLACFYGTQDEAVSALGQVINEYVKLKGRIGSKDSDAVVGEAVATLKKLCLTRSGPEEAVRQLKEIAASHVLDEAGAHAWNCIGDAYRAEGKTDLAEQAFLTVDRLYPTSPVRYTAMMSAGDMYDAVAKGCEARQDYENAIATWKKVYTLYPDQRRKMETAYVIGSFLHLIGRDTEARQYLATVRKIPSEEFANLRYQAGYLEAQICADGGDAATALGILERLVVDCQDPELLPQAQRLLSLLLARQAALAERDAGR